MNKLIDWMTNNFAPKASKISHNPWISAVQETMIAIMPIILISSFVTILSIFQEYIPGFPDFSFISSFSFGIASIFVAYLIPSTVLEKKKLKKYQKQAGLMGIALFMMMIVPVINDDYQLVIDFSRLGTGGMFVAIFGGLVVAMIMAFCTKFSLFKRDTAMPKFLVNSFDSMFPVLLIMVLGYVCCYMCHLDLYAIINMGLSPLADIAQSFWGFVLIMFLMGFFYSFGISPWLLDPIYYPIGLNAIAINVANAAKGIEPSLITTNEVFMGWIWLGGTGCTLLLCVFFLFAKSEKLKTIGKTSIVPSFMNINEPVVFGAVVLNPILMIPMWICSLIVPVITYLAFNMDLVTIPSKIFGLWYAPVGVSTYLINHDFRGLILLAVLLALTGLIYYPFFKVYDNQLVKEEKELIAEERE